MRGAGALNGAKQHGGGETHGSIHSCQGASGKPDKLLCLLAGSAVFSHNALIDSS